MHKVAMPVFTVILVATLCIPGSAFAYSAVYVESVSPESVSSDYSYFSPAGDFVFEKEGISSGADVDIIDGLRITFEELTDDQRIRSISLELQGLVNMDGKTVVLSAAPADSPSVRVQSQAAVSGGRVVASVALDSNAESWLLYMTVKNLTAAVNAEDVLFYLSADVSDDSGEYSALYSATGRITMDLAVIIHPTDKDGSKDVADSINDPAHGGTGSGMSGHISGATTDGFKADPNNGVTYGGKTYPAAYIEFNTKTHDVGKEGEKFDVTFTVPAGLEFGIKMVANRNSTATVTVNDQEVSLRNITGVADTVAYVGMDKDGNLVLDRNNLFYNPSIKWMSFPEPVEITVSGDMGEDGWLITSSFTVEVYMKPTVQNQ